MNNKKEIQFNTVNINEKTEEICVYKLGSGKGTEKSGDDKNLDLGQDMGILSKLRTLRKSLSIK